MAKPVQKFKTPHLANPENLAWLSDAQKMAQDHAPDWIVAMRETGAESFAVTGLPKPAQEGWQYTNLRPLKSPYAYSSDTPQVDVLPDALMADTYRVVLINGQYHENISTLPKDAQITSVMDGAEAKDFLVTVGDLADAPFVALNAAYMRDGVVIKIPAHKTIDKPIEVLFYNTGDVAVYPRAVYWVGENAEATIIERHMGEGAYFANIYTAHEIEKSARLKVYRFVEQDDRAVHISQTLVRQGKNSVFEGFSGAFSGLVTRQGIEMQLIDDHISSTINGMYLLKDKQNHDFAILAQHFEENGMSAQHFKGVLDDEAKSIFQGKIFVHRPAQKTDGYQSHDALLLSERAESNAKPELEIYADDVKCSHGATSGMLDKKALLYLQSRGIPKEEARALLIQSFLGESIERISCEQVRELYLEKAVAWLLRRKKA